MRRYAVPLVITGSLIVLGALFMLFKTITEESPAPVATRAPADRTVAERPSPTQATGIPAIRAPQARSARPDIAPTSGGAAPSEGPGAAPSGAAEDDTTAGTRLNTKNLQFGVPQLREQIAANSEKIRECVRAAGGTASGDAVVTFIVAKKADKIVVEQTDIDRDQTTVQGEQLLECMHQAATSMRFDGLPREADAIIVTRALKLDAGQLAEDRFVKFSYIR